MGAVANTGPNGQGRMPPLPIPDLHDADDETPLVAVDVLKEQYGRGELDLDRYLQRLVKARRTDAPPFPPATTRPREPAAPPEPVPDARPAVPPVAEIPAPSIPSDAAEAVLEPTHRYDVTPESLALRARASFALALIAALATWLVLREDHRFVTSPPRATLAPLVALALPSLDAPLASTELAVASPVLPPVSMPRTAATVGFAAPGRIVASESARYITIPVRASGLRAPVTLSVTTASGAARVNEDFVPPVPTMRLTPAQPSGRVLVSILRDDVPENVEDFSVRLATKGGAATVDAGRVVVVLTDDRAGSSGRPASP